MNADSSRFRSAPSYYAVASSRPIRELVDDRTASIYELGVHNLQLSPGGGSLPEKERHFEAGLLDLRIARGPLFGEPARRRDHRRHPLPRRRHHPEPGAGRDLHRGNLPDRPIGPRWQVVAVATRDIQIDKSGFERDVWLASRRHRLRLRPRIGRSFARPRMGRRGRFPPPLLSAWPKLILTAPG